MGVPEMDSAAFRSIAFAVSLGIGWRCAAVHESGPTPNFRVAELLPPRGAPLYLLCSVDGNWALSSRFHPLSSALEFVDHDELAMQLKRGFGIELLSRMELMQPFSPRPYLSASDIRYWRPRTLGEGLFNWWD